MALTFVKRKEVEKHRVEIWTAPVWYADVDMQDVSVKSGSLIWAPTWEMVTKYLNGEMSEAVYTKKYEKMMDHSYRQYWHVWEKVLQAQRVVFGCYCKKGAFCHRVLLAKRFEKLGGIYKGELL